MNQVRPQTCKPLVPKKAVSRTVALGAAFKDVNIHMFADITRIKKPSKAALITGQLLSSFVLLMRDAYNPSSTIKTVEPLEWAEILQLITGNLLKFTLEVQGIKEKL